MVTLNSYNRTPSNNTTSTGLRDKGYYESAKISHEHHNNYDHLIANNPVNKTKATVHKIVNGFTTYPAKGLKGDENSSLYEFLAMGTVPYIIGSATLISVFNSSSKHFMPRSAKEAAKVGKKLGAGVVAYGVAKFLGQKSVNEPVRAMTGVDFDKPYKKVVYELPPNATEKGKKREEYHKVFESIDFPRWDLMYAEGVRKGNRNQYFDDIAKKNNMGDLHASDQELKPKIKEMASKTRTWKTITGYLWAAAAVGLTAQAPWEKLFVNKGHKQAFIGKVSNGAVSIVKNTRRSFVEMWNGGAKATKASKAVGRGLLLASAASTVIGVASSVAGFRSKPKQVDVIRQDQKVYES